MRTVVLDANLLVLLVLGLTDKDLIGKHRRAKEYLPEDFDILEAKLRQFKLLLVTPHALAETSNLIGYGPKSTVDSLRKTLAVLVDEHIAEPNLAAKVLVKIGPYVRLGLTDVGMLDMLDASSELLTVDLDLYHRALSDGHQATNFNHLRTPALAT